MDDQQAGLANVWIIWPYNGLNVMISMVPMIEIITLFFRISPQPSLKTHNLVPKQVALTGAPARGVCMLN